MPRRFGNGQHVISFADGCQGGGGCRRSAGGGRRRSGGGRRWQAGNRAGSAGGGRGGHRRWAISSGGGSERRCDWPGGGRTASCRLAAQPALRRYAKATCQAERLSGRQLIRWAAPRAAASRERRLAASGGPPGSSSLGGGRQRRAEVTQGKAAQRRWRICGKRSPHGQSGAASEVGQGQRNERRHGVGQGAGNNWGLPGSRGRVTAITRPIHVAVLADRLVLVPEQGDDRPPQHVPHLARACAAGSRCVCGGRAEEMKSWGLAVAERLLEAAVLHRGRARRRGHV